MRRLALIVALLLVVSAGSAFAGAQLWNLGAGKSTGMVSGGGIVAYDSGTSAKLWNNGTSHNLGTGFTAGVAMKGSTVVVAGGTAPTVSGYSGVAKRWDGDASGAGTWSNLPQDGGCDWTPMCIGASATDVSIGGSCLWDGVWYGDRYQESLGYTTEGIRPGKPQFPEDYTNDSFVYGITATNQCAGLAHYKASNQARQAIGGQVVAGINGLQGFDTLYGAPDLSHESSANAIAADGSRIVGWSWAANPAQNQAVYWNAPYSNYEAPTAIPLLAGNYWARAFGVSSNGTYVVGSSYTISPETVRAWVWDSVNGTRDLETVLAAAGIDLTGWTSLAYSDSNQMGPTAVSADGKWFTGTGTRGGVATAWVRSSPSPAACPYSLWACSA